MKSAEKISPDFSLVFERLSTASVVIVSLMSFGKTKFSNKVLSNVGSRMLSMSRMTEPVNISDDTQI